MPLCFRGPLRPSELADAVAQWRHPDHAGGGVRLAGCDSLFNLLVSGAVAGYAVAEKATDGHAAGELALRLYVKRKRARTRLAHGDTVPAAVDCILTGGEVVTVPTDVVEMPSVPVAQAGLSGARTVNSGDSISNWLGSVGTFGLHVQSGVGADYALTCAHVVAAPWNRYPAGDLVDSPAVNPQDAGAAGFGNVESWSILDPAVFNTVDAALIRAGGGITLRNDALRLGPSPSFVEDVDQFLTSTPRSNIEVHSRRGIIKGSIDAIDNNHEVGFGNQQSFFFSRILSYLAPVQAGDSGSAVVDAGSCRVLGLHFAGDEGANRGYCILFQNIVKMFKTYGLTIGA